MDLPPQPSAPEPCSTQPRLSRFAPLGIALLLAVLTVLVYLPAVRHEFVNWDDLTYVVENDHVKGGLTWNGLTWAFTHNYASNWHPLTWISHMLDVQLFGLAPGWHHLTNVLLHTANGLLLFLLLQYMTGAVWRSGLVAALFALHPLHVESVAWIAERKDVLSTFFFLLALLAYAAYAKSTVHSPQSTVNPKSEVQSPRPGVQNWVSQATIKLTPRPSSILYPLSSHWYWLALVLFAVGLMSKPMLVTLPFVLLLLDYWPLGRFSPKSNVQSPKSPTSEAASGFRTPHSALRTGKSPQSTVHSPQSSGSDQERGFRTPHSPLRTGEGPQSNVQRPKSSKGWCGVECAALVVEKWPFFVLAAISCVITFQAQKQGGAVASLQHFTFSSRLENAVVAYGNYVLKTFWPADLSPIYPHPNHWALWPVLGSAMLLLVITAVAGLYRRRLPFVLTGWLWFLGTLVPVIGIVQVGNQAFADRYAYIPLIGLFAAVVWLAGEAAQQMALPKGLVGVASIGTVAALIWVTSRDLPVWKNTGTLFSRALELDQNNVQALYSLGGYFIDNGQLDEGTRLLLKAIELRPAYPEALATLANTLDGQGKYSDAMRFYQAALKAQPSEAGVLNNLAWLRAACADPSFRNGPEAVRLATRACELTKWEKPLFIGTLAAAQAESGDFQAAIATAQRAAALASSLRLEQTAARNRELIELYRQGKAAHGAAPKASVSQQGLIGKRPVKHDRTGTGGHAVRTGRATDDLIRAAGRLTRLEHAGVSDRADAPLILDADGWSRGRRSRFNDEIANAPGAIRRTT